MSIEKLDFSKVTKENIPYTLISNKVIQNIKDPVAGFIWVYLSSLPPNWDVNKEHLKKKFGLGNNKLKRILAYLSRSNLIQYVRLRNDDGTLDIMAIHILCGDKFDINQPFESTGSKSEPVELSTGSTTGSIIHPVVNQTSGSGLLQKKYKDTNTNKREREAIRASRALSVFSPNEENKMLAKDFGLDLDQELISFKERHKGSKTQYEFGRWLKNAREYQSTKKGFSPQEIRSTVMEYGPGHPVWEQNRRWEIENGKRSQGSEGERHHVRGDGMHKAQKYLF